MRVAYVPRKLSSGDELHCLAGWLAFRTHYKRVAVSLAD
jgi:hypothetical protein